ncbi:hypothetical protein [Actinoplanes sp. NPDC049802]|uniref:hypothetical protein n=1 Tax=Actinoplanes sp. NPDC049802 TaxID=3154742 RepID=UPI0033F1F18A
MRNDVTRRMDRWRGAAGRATAVPFMVRCGILLSGLLATAVAWPLEMLSNPRLMSLPVAAVIWATMAPRGRGGTAAALSVIVGWLVNSTGFGASIDLWRVLTLAALLYLGHTLTALAAVLPYDAMVNLDVPALWLGRALVVVLVSAVVIVLALGLTADLGGDAFQLATLIGLASAATVTLVLTRMVRR